MRQEGPIALLLRHRWLLGAIATGIGLRIAVVLLLPDMPLVGDEKVYLKASQDLAAGREVSNFPFRSPLYIFLCAAILKLGTPSADGIRIIQCVLEAFAILGIYLLGRRMLGERVGSSAAWLYALYPDFIAYSHYLWSESLALLLLIWSLLAICWLRDKPTLGRALIVGLAWGLSSLNKPACLYLSPPLLAWVVYVTSPDMRAVALRQAGIAFATVILTITPWSLHLSLKHDRFILVSTTGAHNLNIGNNNYSPPHYDLPSGNTYTRERARKLGRKIGLLPWVAANPGLFAERALLKMTYLWSPTSFAIRHIYWDKYMYSPWILTSAPLRLSIAYSVIFSTMAILLLSIAGYFASRRKHAFAFGLTAAYASPYLAMITLTPALSRYRLPLMVFALLYAAYALTHSRELRRELPRPRTAVPAAIVGLVLVALWWDSVPALWKVLA